MDRRVVLGNAFSIGMLTGSVVLEFEKISVERARELWNEGRNKVSVVGHQGTVELLKQLGFKDVQFNRVRFEKQRNDVLIVVQLKVRLQEGQVLSREQLEEMLKEGKIEFWVVREVQ